MRTLLIITLLSSAMASYSAPPQVQLSQQDLPAVAFLATISQPVRRQPHNVYMTFNENSSLNSQETAALLYGRCLGCLAAPFICLCSPYLAILAFCTMKKATQPQY